MTGVQGTSDVAAVGVEQAPMGPGQRPLFTTPDSRNRPAPGIGPARLTAAKQSPNRAARRRLTLDRGLEPNCGSGDLKIVAAIL